jgi:hypothetical protein
MEIPKDKKIYESPIAHIWLDDDGILCIVTKNVARTGENVKAHYSKVNELINEKVCCLVDLQICKDFHLESREVILDEAPALYKAFALIAQKPCEQFISKFFMPLEKEGLPVRSFYTEEEARDWLKNF